MATLRALAPAKVNLYLHVTGRREDGYHQLDSLTAFTDFGDEIALSPANAFQLSLSGPFAAQTPLEQNLVEKTAYALAARLDIPPDFHVSLTKNIPAGAGLGGGSADAAAIARLMMHMSGKTGDIDDILLALGADVPACYRSDPLRFFGIGEGIELVRPFPTTPILLVNSGTLCPTADVFRALRDVSDSDKLPLPPLDNQDALFRFLKNTRNDLSLAAQSMIPNLAEVLQAIEQTGSAIARMSGSGATCFGLYEDEEVCRRAAEMMTKTNPGWWIKATRLQGV